MGNIASLAIARERWRSFYTLRVSGSKRSSKRAYVLLLVAAGYLLAAGVLYLMLRGPESAAAPQTTISSGILAPQVASATATQGVGNLLPTTATPATSTPIATEPKPLLTILEPPSTLTTNTADSADTDSADTDSAATSEPADSTANPDNTQTPAATETATSSEGSATTDDVGDTAGTAAAATSAPEPTATSSAAAAEPEPTATPVVVTNPAPVATETVATEPLVKPELPAYSSGGSFTNVLRALPTTAKARIFDEPGGQELQVTYEYLNGNTVQNDLVNPTHFGNPLSLRVIRGAPGDEWAMVELPTRPNGQTGWVQTSPYEWGSSNHLVQINVSTNSVTIWEGETVVLETAAVTGKSTTPTPVLTGFVDEKVYGLGGAYGPVLLSLGVFSNSLNTFGANGEAPKIALHGTNAPELMGQYASNGCIRVPNEIIQQIAELVPVGSRVEIVS